MRQRSLRFRITLTLFLFVSLSSSLFALAIFYAFDVTEEQLFDESLEQEFRQYEQIKRSDPDHPLPYSSALHSYLTGQEDTQNLPPELWRLGPGFHHDIVMSDRFYHVLVKELGEERIYLAQDITHVEQRESRLAYVLIMGVLFFSIAAVWSGYLLSRPVIAPVTDLADRVSQLEPGQHSVPLAHEFSDTEVVVIARAFDLFLERLDQFITREHAFTEDASHELRTPLAVIRSATELLLADVGMAESVRLPLRRILRASAQMTRLTRALLFLAREADAGETEEISCRADTVIAEIVDVYHQLQTGYPVEILCETPEPTTLPVPPELVEIVAANLLQNALAHTRQGQIRVTLVGGVLTVEDTGSGILPEDLPRVFERNFRGAGSRGTGRGLDLVKRICDRCGWRAEVASQPGQGSRFTVSFSKFHTSS